ncbi:MAG: hypothetical protein STSR0004_13660 [Peptococcaceae bacterium]
MALTANGKKTPDILNRVQLDVEWLIQVQGNDPYNMLSFGGWNHFNCPELATAFTTQHAILALSFAASWGLKAPQETWNRAITWYKINHDINNNGSYVYSLDDASRLNYKEILYNTTAGALSNLKIIKLFSANPGVKSQALNLLDSALGWLKINYTVELDLGITDSAQYYYLFNLQRGCVIEPYFTLIGNHDWYADIVDYLVDQQKKDGNWSSSYAGKKLLTLNLRQLFSGRSPGNWVFEKTTEKIVYSSLALLTLSRTAMPVPDYGKDKKEQTKSDYAGLNEMIDIEHTGSHNDEQQDAKSPYITKQTVQENTEHGGEVGSGDSLEDGDSLQLPDNKDDADEKDAGAGASPEKDEKSNGKNKYRNSKDKNDRSSGKLSAAIMAFIGLILCKKTRE